MKMLNTKSLLTGALAGTLLIASGLASAGICDAEYSALVADINLAGSLSDRDATGLTGKANASQSKANQGKIADAVQKLEDARSALNGMLGAAKPKVSPADYNLLINDINAAEACLALVK